MIIQDYVNKFNLGNNKDNKKYIKINDIAKNKILL